MSDKIVLLSSDMLFRERAMVVNLECIKAIVTAEEVLLLDPRRQEVLPFVDQLRHQLSHQRHSNTSGNQGGILLALRDTETNLSASGRWLNAPEANEGLPAELPFEFQVLEIALEVVCTYLDSSVADLERDAYPILDELAKNVSTKNLERVRSLKSNLTRLLARVQKVRDELEHLLDDNEDMTRLYLTRKWLQNQPSEALLGGVGSVSFTSDAHHLRRHSSVKSGSMLTSANLNDDDVEDLEMLLEAYFIQLDGTQKMTIKEVRGESVMEWKTKVTTKEGIVIKFPGKFRGYKLATEEEVEENEGLKEVWEQMEYVISDSDSDLESTTKTWFELASKLQPRYRSQTDPDIATIIVQQLQNIIPQIVTQVTTNVNNATGGNGNDGNDGCSYKTFTACNPKEFDGKGGAVALTRWIEKMESVFDNSGCTANQRVKYAASCFVKKALTWWNTQVQARGREAVIGMSWNDFRALLMEEFCPSNEMEKL
ncbi:magnesium transporter MRS2-4 [Tanacetum coccineum]